MAISKKLINGGVLAMALASVTTAKAYTFEATGTGADSDLSARAVFVVNGTNLEITLTNISTFDVLAPPDVLTGVFFTLAADPTLTPVSATLEGGSTVFFGPDGSGNVGGEWAYGDGLAGAPDSSDEGISSAGFGLFGDANFGGANLEGPTAVNGLNYGILSAGDDTGTGNTPVTGSLPLIKNSVKFVLSGLPGDFVADASTISHINFQYGTSLNEPNIPEPTAGVLVGLGMAAFALIRRRSH